MLIWFVFSVVWLFEEYFVEFVDYDFIVVLEDDFDMIVCGE